MVQTDPKPSLQTKRNKEAPTDLLHSQVAQPSLGQKRSSEQVDRTVSQHSEVADGQFSPIRQLSEVVKNEPGSRSFRQPVSPVADRNTCHERDTVIVLDSTDSK